MRIGTWNLECGGRSRRAAAGQRARLSEIVADVMVFTEPGPELSEEGPGRVVSPALRELPNGKGAWVAIRGAGVVPVGPALPYGRMAVAGRVPGSVVVYGSVLPWLGIARHAPDLVQPGETYAAAFARVLDEQVADVRGLVEQFPEELVVWAGDFNKSLEGPNFGGSGAGRAALQAALDGLEFRAWNAGSPHASAGMCAIDLVCGPAGVRVEDVDVIEAGGVTDHAGYVVSLS